MNFLLSPVHPVSPYSSYVNMSLNIISFIVRAIAFLRIVVPKNPKWTDVFVHILWILLALISSLVNVINSIYILNLKQLDSFKLSYIGADSMGVVMATIPFPLLANFVRKNDYLLFEEKLSRPVRLPHFLMTIMLQVSSMIGVPLSTFPTTLNYFTFGCIVVSAMSTFMIAGISIFFLGVSAERFCKKVDQIKTESLTDMEQNLRNISYSFQQLKLGAEPFLFLIFSIDSILFIFACYLMKKDQLILSLIVHEILKLSYIALAMEDCYQKYKSLIKTCR